MPIDIGFQLKARADIFKRLLYFVNSDLDLGPLFHRYWNKYGKVDQLLNSIWNTCLNGEERAVENLFDLTALFFLSCSF